MNVLHRWSDLRDEPLTCLRQGDASRRPVEEPYAKRSLQLSHGVPQ
jgi:hypothetical protein